MSVYQKVAPKQNLSKFLSDMKERGKTIEAVPPRFPYADNDNCQAFEVEHNNRTFYFCFGSEGQLLHKRID